MNKPIYLGLSILDISEILMYEFSYDYMKVKYGNNVKLCYMDTDSFIMSIKTNDFYKDISSVKLGLLARNEVRLFQIFDHVKTIKKY